MRVFIWFALIIPARSTSSELLRREQPKTESRVVGDGDGGHTQLPDVIERPPTESKDDADGGVFHPPGVLDDPVAKTTVDARGDGGQTQLPDLLDELIWDGVDVPNVPDIDASNRTMSKDVTALASRIPLQILGLFDTGTNFVQQLMISNFKDTIQITPYVWKHSSPRNMSESKISEVFQREHAVTIAMVRNPMSWLQSVHEHPYDMHPCLEKADWLNTPCSLPPQTTRYDPREEWLKFKSVAEWWNWNVHDYTQLGALGFPKVAVVQYEDLVRNTEAVMKRIVSTLGLPQLHKVNVFGELGSNGRQKAVEKLETKSYLKLYKGNEKGKACKILDKELMKHFHYLDCEKS